ncbi:MAG TPA: DUF58 domain-containing protein, partial [Planctomycetota bacterium]|nr:DUF58 domain-containing protein [Planctomycetota bacterium]
RRPFAGRIRGEHRSVRRGHSLEFADYRNYIQGDDLRFVDWKLYARLDRLFLKLFMEEEDLFVYVLLDASHSMGLGEPPKLPFAKKVAAALGYLALAGTHRVSIQAFDAGLRPALPLVRGRGGFPRVTSYVERVGASGGTDTRSAFTDFRRRLRGTGLVFLISDLLDRDGVLDGLKQFLAGRFDVTVLHVLSPDEEDPAFEGDWRLVDIEDGGEVPLSMTAQLLEAYGKTVRAFRGEQQAICQRLGFRYLPIRSDVTLEGMFLHRFREQGVLR